MLFDPQFLKASFTVQLFDLIKVRCIQACNILLLESFDNWGFRFK